MRQIVSLFSLFAILLYCLAIKPEVVLAFGLYDTFDTYNSDIWSYQSPVKESISITDSILNLKKISNYKFPFLSINLENDNVFEVEFKFKFVGNPNYGAGIAASAEILHDGTLEHPKLDNSIFMIWPKANTGFGVFTPLCKFDNPNCINNGKALFDGQSNIFYTFKVTYNNQIYKFYVDNVEVFTSVATNKKIIDFWIGNPQQTGFVIWPELFLDYVIINQYTANKPVIIIPGMGASWDFEAMFKGTEGSNWAIPSFVKNYDSLIASFENVGYVKDKDLFIFPYDWRKPISDNSARLNTFVNANINSDKKLSIVAHSMGGLIARDYLQNYGSQKVDKIITMGTPHRGAVDAYSLWEGATLWDDIWWGKLAIEATVQLNGSDLVSRVSTLREQIPSIKNVLPNFDFIKHDGNLVNWSEMNQTNTYIDTLNKDFIKTVNSMYAINGKDNSTRSVVITRDRDLVDKVFDFWEDGKPIDENQFEYADGDGTVLDKSANFEIVNISTFSTSHFNLPANKNAIETVFETLGLDKTKVKIVDTDERKDVLAFFLRSPGKLNICNAENVCDSDLGVYLPDQKMFFMPGYQGQPLNLKIKEDGTGRYKVHVGKLNTTADWEVFEGNLVNSGQLDEFQILSDGDNLRLMALNDTNKKLLTVCKDDLNTQSPLWDKNNYLEALANETNPKDIRLRSFRIVTNLLGNLLAIGSTTQNSKLISKTLDCWEKINDELKLILSEDKNDFAQKHLDQTDRLSEIIGDKFNELSNNNSLKIKHKAEKILANGRMTATKTGRATSELAFSMDKLFLSTYLSR